MQEQPIEFETAKILHGKGFKLEIAQYNYSEENNFELGFNVYTKEDLDKFKIYPAPSQSLLQKWLRENHKIHIQIQMDEPDSWGGCLHILNNDENTGYWTYFYKTYEDALEYQLKEALKYI